MAANFINRDNRTYLYVNGIEAGFYRESLLGGYVAKYGFAYHADYRECKFDTEQAAQDWFKSLV